MNNGNRDKSEIPDKMLLYEYAGGEILEGLVRRRNAEINLYKNGNSGNSGNSGLSSNDIVHLVMVFALLLMNVLKEEEVMFRGNVQMTLIM